MASIYTATKPALTRELNRLKRAKAIPKKADVKWMKGFHLYSIQWTIPEKSVAPYTKQLFKTLTRLGYEHEGLGRYETSKFTVGLAHIGHGNMRLSVGTHIGGARRRLRTYNIYTFSRKEGLVLHGEVSGKGLTHFKARQKGAEMYKLPIGQVRSREV